MVSTIERAVTKIRHELRERLLDESHDGVGELLDTLELLADQAQGAERRDLINETERWRLRFDMLAALQELAGEMADAEDMEEAA